MAGEVAKAAAKLTGVPVMPGGIRGKAAEHLPASSSLRMAISVRPSVATVSSGEVGAAEQMPRVVFHGAPTLEEAKEANSELIVGIEKIYPWSHCFDGYENSVIAKHESDSSLSNSQVEPAKACDSGEIKMEPAVPTTAYNAFRLLRESSAARNLVASIACDPNVVKSVQLSQQFQEFPNSERKCWASSLPMANSVCPAAATVSSDEVGAAEQMPRVVFHDTPTLEEAKEATSELIVGIEKIYPLSHDSDGYQNSVIAKHKSDSSLSNSQVEPAKASDSGEIKMEPAVPTTAYNAFRLLHENSAARNVVASIACDPNVVNAVRQNQQLQEFLHLVSNQQLQEFLHSESRGWASSHSVTGAVRLDMLPAKSIEYSSNDSESKRGGISFEDLLKKIKDVVNMMKNLPDSFKNLFGGEGAKSSANGDHGVPGASTERVIETSLLGLAIMIIMLIFLKRV